jgi:hypothetical protein
MGKSVKKWISSPNDGKREANPEQSARYNDQIECGGAKGDML